MDSYEHIIHQCLLETVILIPLGVIPTSADGDYSLSIIVLYSERVRRVDNYSEFKLHHGLMTIYPNH